MKTLASETALQKEQRLFKELFVRWIDALLNRIFDVHPKNASRRSTVFFLLFIFNGFVITLYYYPPSSWIEQFNTTTTELLTFIRLVITDPRILRFLPVFIAPYIIALHSAAVYLADVFELGDASVARHFIRGVSLSGSNETIRIKNGEVADEHRDSPVFLIGGPGKVVVDLDSAALFEKADGTPHVIGPTGKEPGGRATLEGFERFRHSLDIRNHHIDLRDQDNKSKAVQSRSLDGIPVKATDVRLMFSIFRGDNPETSAEHPYPFSKEAVEHIVYKAVSRVTPELSNPSTFEFSWINNMVGLIRGRLSGFMSQHKLTDYLASIGMPEIEKLNQREDIISDQMQQLTTSNNDAVERKEITAPDFQARYMIKNLFTQFTDEFTRKARSNGVELHWIGVGTWESSVKDVLGKHLEAWLLTQENLKNEELTNKLEQMEVVEKMKSLIRKIPIDVYDELIETSYLNKRPKRQITKGKPNGKAELPSGEFDEDILDEMEQFTLKLLEGNMDSSDEVKQEHREADHKYELRTLLIAYRNQFIETQDLIKAKNEPVPKNLQDAIDIIGRQINAHWVGS